MVTRFIFADNQELTCFALESLVSRDWPEARLFCAHDKAELLALLDEENSSVVLLDYTLFDFTGPEALLHLSQRFPLVQWVLMSEELTDSFVRQVAYSSQNVSVVFKDCTLQTVKAALQSVTCGKRYICQRATEILLEQQHREEEAIPLTPTEIEIVKCIVQGKTTKEIAAERFCSIHTINTHRKNIFRKLGLNTAHDVIRYAYRAGLADAGDLYYI